MGLGLSLIVSERETILTQLIESVKMVNAETHLISLFIAISDC